MKKTEIVIATVAGFVGGLTGILVYWLIEFNRRLDQNHAREIFLHRLELYRDLLETDLDSLKSHIDRIVKLADQVDAVAGNPAVHDPLELAQSMVGDLYNAVSMMYQQGQENLRLGRYNLNLLETDWLALKHNVNSISAQVMVVQQYLNELVPVS